MPTPTPTVLVHAITFAHPGAAGSVPLRETATDRLIWDVPAWVEGAPPATTAFVRGSRPVLKVVFRRAEPGGPPSISCLVKARGTGGPGVSPTRLDLHFGPDGLADPVELALDQPLRNAVGAQTVRWEWEADMGNATARAGTTEHRLLLTWRRPLESALWDDQALTRSPDPTGGVWVYDQIADWTCTWAAGVDGEKALCDAIIGNVAASRLKYGVGAWHVRQMLQRGGGMCGGWYRMFQAMAAAQGVRVERRKFMVDWRTSGQDAAWCALVVRNPGLNQSQPTDGASAFHDVSAQPIVGAPVHDCTERRYRFWGHPGRPADGHCINLLDADGRWFVYDACFFDHAIPLDRFAPPEPDRARTVDVAHLGTFRSAYLERSVDYLLGSWGNNGTRYDTTHGENDAHSTNGLTVDTVIVDPTLSGFGPGITFYWDA